MHSKRWLEEHFKDPYVKRSKKEGYVSRAAYKLLEIQERDHIFKEGMRVLDLGAAPGGWSQVAIAHVGKRGKVVATDILAMTPPAGVQFVQGDFTEQAVLDEILSVIGEQQMDIVMSDMAPNLSGQKIIDQPRSMYLVELAWDCAQQVLADGGTFLAKVFQGHGVDAFTAEIKKHFKKCKCRKPEASRARSREVYILGCGFMRYNQNSSGK